MTSEGEDVTVPDKLTPEAVGIDMLEAAATNRFASFELLET